MAWLETLGEVKTNWAQLTMEFAYKDRTVRLQGEQSLLKAETSLRSFVKQGHNSAECYLVQVQSIDSEPARHDAPPIIQQTLWDFQDVFAEPKGLPPIRGHEHSIVLKEGTSPISVRPYRYAQAQKDEIEKLVDEMLKAGVIQPSSSPYSSPVLLVKKKDGSWRFCVDYRELNKQTVPDKFPIPVIDELLDELHGATIFSKIDLKSGYHQICMTKGDEPKTAFRTHEGQYEFLVMPFGLMNAPATFQALMNQVFKPWLRKFVLVFFDDILIYSRSIEEHAEHLKLILTELRKHKLVANGKKSSFGRESIEYLGHVVSKDGVSADELKIKAMQEWPEPKNVKELRGFLGLTGYYRKFVKDYSKVAWGLTEQLKKDAFSWNDQASKAFKALKEAMTQVPVLALPNFSESFIIETDASGYGLGAVLMQNKRPIAYFSRVLSSRARQKSVYERELMAIVLAITKWRPYLLGRHFIVRTDQKALKYLLEQRMVAEEHQKWLTKLLGYDFEIQYKPGKENQAADALSRMAEPTPIEMQMTKAEADLEDKVNLKGAGNDRNSVLTPEMHLSEVLTALEDHPEVFTAYAKVLKAKIMDLAEVSQESGILPKSAPTAQGAKALSKDFELAILKKGPEVSDPTTEPKAHASATSPVSKSRIEGAILGDLGQQSRNKGTIEEYPGLILQVNPIPEDPPQIDGHNHTFPYSHELTNQQGSRRQSRDHNGDNIAHSRPRICLAPYSAGQPINKTP